MLRVFVLAFGISVVTAGGGGNTSGWTQVLSAAPWSARSDPQLAILNGTLLLLGGHANSDYYNDVWSSEDAGATWQQRAAAPWAPRSYHTAKVHEGHLYMLGGHNNDTWFNDVWRTADGDSWELVNAHADWTPRAATGLQFRRGRMFVLGGSNGLLKPIGNGSVFNDVWNSDDLGKTWKQSTPHAPWPAREGLQKLTALYGDEDTIVLTAGEAGYFGPYYHDVWGTTDGAEWQLLNPAADYSARSGNLLLNAGGALFTFGGYGLPMKHDGYCLPPGNVSGTWKKLPSAPWHGRFDYDMEVLDGSIILLGGEASLFGAGGPYYNDVWLYKAATCPT